MSDAGRIEIERALARFLDDEPEPSDGERLADAMRSDEAFESEVIGMLIVDDLLRQDSLADDRAFVESLNLRLGAESERDRFLIRFTQFFNDRVSPVRRGTPFLPAFGAITAAAIVICTLSAAFLGYYWRGASAATVGEVRAGRAEIGDRARTRIRRLSPGRDERGGDPHPARWIRSGMRARWRSTKVRRSRGVPSGSPPA